MTIMALISSGDGYLPTRGDLPPLPSGTRPLPGGYYLLPAPEIQCILRVCHQDLDGRTSAPVRLAAANVVSLAMQLPGEGPLFINPFIQGADIIVGRAALLALGVMEPPDGGVVQLGCAVLTFQHDTPVYRPTDVPWRVEGGPAPGQASFVTTAIVGDWALEGAQVIWSGRGDVGRGTAVGSTTVQPATAGAGRAVEFPVHRQRPLGYTGTFKCPRYVMTFPCGALPVDFDGAAAATSLLLAGSVAV